jgi:hypothetical protein
MEQARKVSDAVLYEGYLLYPYRASADKNRLRWQFGVLVPSVLAEAGWPEPSRSRTECLLDLPAGNAPVEVAVTARFLQVWPREGAGPSFDEGVEREVTASMPVHRLIEAEHAVAFDFVGGSGALRVSAGHCAGSVDALRLPVVLENTPQPIETPDRPAPVEAAVVDGPAVDGHAADPGVRPRAALEKRPRRVFVVGVEPADVSDTLGLSRPVAAALDDAVRTVKDLVKEGAAHG